VSQDLSRSAAYPIDQLAVNRQAEPTDMIGFCDCRRPWSDLEEVCAGEIWSKELPAWRPHGSTPPAIYESREFVDAGGLVSYGPSLPALQRRAADYVSMILKGSKPGDIPGEQPIKFELITT